MHLLNAFSWFPWTFNFTIILNGCWSINVCYERLSLLMGETAEKPKSAERPNEGQLANRPRDRMESAEWSNAFMHTYIHMYIYSFVWTDEDDYLRAREKIIPERAHNHVCVWEAQEKNCDWAREKSMKQRIEREWEGNKEERRKRVKKGRTNEDREIEENNKDKKKKRLCGEQGWNPN